MANKYAGTQTEKNLEAAFAGESQARNKYTYFASRAKKDGFEQIAALFQKTADNEKEHAKLWFKELEGIGDTAQNLKAAAEGENYEWTNGPTCTKVSRRPLKKKASPRSPRSSVWSPPSKRLTKNATAHSSRTWKRPRSSKRAKSRFGNAATADTSWSARRPLTSAPSAPTRKPTSKFTKRTIKNRSRDKKRGMLQQDTAPLV